MALPPRIGRYRVLGVLGQGAMGIVYRGRDEALERDVALKVMSVGQADADSRARFQKEARAAARLQHPNIVTIYELGEHEGAPFMALELLEGMDLQRAIEAGIRPDPKVTLPIVLQVLAGLGHAHEHGIVHRDVKPSNVFLPRARPAKIMDFGVARLAGGTTAGLTGTGTLVGTPNYMSPEQVQGAGVDGRSDLFSTGLILYELVTGEKAYRGDTVVALLFKIAHEEPDLSLLPRGPRWERLRTVQTRSVARKPDERYPDAAAMAKELAQALVDLGGAVDWTAPADLALMVRAVPRPTPLTEVPPPAPSALPSTPPPAASPPGRSLPAPSAAAVSRRPAIVAGVLGSLSIAVLGFALFVSRRPTGAPASSPSRVSATPSPSTGPGDAHTLALPKPKATEVKGPSAAALPPAPAATLFPPASPQTPVVPTPGTPRQTPLPSTPEAPSPADARLDRGNDLMEKGRYQEALAVARAILAREPNNADAKALAGDAEAAIVIETCVKNARASLKAGDRDGALVEIKKGLAVNPSEGRLLALFREATQ